MKKRAAVVLKFAASGTILAVMLVLNRDALLRMWREPKDWLLLAAAGCCCIAAVVGATIRWYWLVRALGVDFRFRDALRLGCFGFLCNFVSLGALGGDFFKAFVVARENPGRRTEVVASVFVDRIMGLAGLLLLVTVATLATGLFHLGEPQLRTLCVGVWTLTSVVYLGGGLMLLPGFTTGSLFEFLTRLPRAGHVFSRLIAALHTYRRCPLVILRSLVWTVGIQLTFVGCVMLVARGLPGPPAQLGSQLVIVPLGVLASSIPLLPGGLGTFEPAMNYLYGVVPNDPAFAAGQGMAVAIGYRALTVVVALVAYAYWMFARRELGDVYRQAQQAAEEEAQLAAEAEALSAA